eukprot:g3283.t1
MPVQVFPSVAVIVLGISAIGAGTWLVDKYIDPRPIPSNSRFYSEWDHQMWLRDERLKKEAAEKKKQSS